MCGFWESRVLGSLYLWNGCLRPKDSMKSCVQVPLGCNSLFFLGHINKLFGNIYIFYVIEIYIYIERKSFQRKHFFFKFLLLFSYSCMPFLLIPPPHPSWTHLPPSPPPSPPFCPCVLCNSSCNPLFPLSPPHSPLAIVRLFLTSMSLVIFCLLFFFYWLCSS